MLMAVGELLEELVCSVCRYVIAGLIACRRKRAKEAAGRNRIDSNLSRSEQIRRLLHMQLMVRSMNLAVGAEA
jgi:hypothetical protein